MKRKSFPLSHWFWLWGTVIILSLCLSAVPSTAKKPQVPCKKTLTTATQTININTATAEQLQALPGIGPALAQRIVEYRQQHGPFQSPQDIMNVPGIGNSKFQNMKNMISTR